MRARRPGPRAPVRRPRVGHRPGRRRGAGGRAGGDRHHEDEPRSSRSTSDERVAWVEPGVLNLDLTRALRAHGLHFAPDPSSQQACSIGGNVANNSGGPHCLAYGVTSAHVLALEVVLPDGVAGGARRARRRAARLRPARRVRRQRRARWASPRASRCGSRRTRRRCARCCSTSLSVEAAAATVSAIIAAGIVPAALEMMDGALIGAVEDFVHAGFPMDAAAVLLVEVDGLPGGVASATSVVTSVGLAHGARTVRVAADDAERAAAVEGAQVRVRRGRPHRAQLLPARHRGAAHAAASRCCARCTRSQPGTSCS